MSKLLRCLGLVSLVTLVGCASDPATPPSQGALDKNTIVRLADRMQQQGDLAMATDFYQRALAEDPANVAAYYGLANVNVAQGDLAAAERAYREALRYDEKNLPILRDYARVLLKQGNYAAAATQYRAALALDSHDSKSLNGLGIALDQLGDHAGAQAQYRAALERNPDDMMTINNLGLSLILAGDYAGAIIVLAPAADSFRATQSLRDNLELAYAKAREAHSTAGNVPLPSVAQPIEMPEPVKAEPEAAPRGGLTLKQRPAAEPPALPPAPPVVQASFGPYATAAMAEARQNDIKLLVAGADSYSARIVVALTPQGTPQFLPNFTGFSDPQEAEQFCQKASKVSFTCLP